MLLNLRLQLDELIHLPAFTVPSLGLPLITFAIFGLPQVHNDSRVAAGVLVGFGCGKTEVQGHSSMLAGNDVCIREVKACT